MFKSIGVLSSGLMLGALINLACLPFLTRIYGIEAYGVYGTVMAVVSVVAVIANGRLDQAILASPPGDRMVLASSGLCITVLVALLVGLISVLFISPTFALAIGVAVASSSLYQLCYSYFLIKGSLKICSMLSVFRGASLCAFQLLLGLYWSSDSLLDGLILQGALLIVLSLIVTIPGLNQVNKDIFLKNLDFLKNNTSHALLSAFSHNVPYILLANFAGATLTGYYAVIDRLCKAPIVLFSQVVRQLFIKKISKSGATSESAKGAVKASLFMLLVGLISYSVVMLIPESVFGFVLGSEWEEIKLYVLCLGIGYVFVFSNPPVSGYIVAARKSYVLIKYQVLELLIKSSVFFVVLGQSEYVLLMSFAMSLAIYNVMIMSHVAKRGFGNAVSA